MPSPGSLVSRFFFGVTSIGAALGLLYWYYSHQQRRKDPADDRNAETNSKRRRRIASGSGNGGTETKNRVTFAEQNEIIGTSCGHQAATPEDDVFDGSSAGSPKAKIETPELTKKVVKIPEDKPEEDKEDEDDDEPSDKLVMEEYKSPIKIEPLMLSKLSEPQQQQAEVVEPLLVAAASIAINGLPGTGTALNGQNHPGIDDLITAETDYDHTSMLREVKIPRDHVSGLIGKKGSHIKSIQNSSNTTINFKDESLENGDRVCVIRGAPPAVTLAESMIEKYILEQPIVTTHTMNIPLSSVGRIIGKGGETIRGIQDASRARVTVDSNGSYNNQYRGAGDGGGGGSTRPVMIKGTEDQIEIARQLIIEKVEEEKSLRRNIDLATQNRTPRRATSNSTSSSPGGLSATPNSSNMNGNALPFKTNGVFEVFVSCAYHPNDFWIQMMGRDAIELDKLTESMTEWYSHGYDAYVGEVRAGDMIAAAFDIDGKMYRGKVLRVDNDDVEVIYVDYGDRRVLKVTEIRSIRPEFLQLRFQAIQATLNLGCIGERWTDQAISEFCDMTYCAQWQPVTARVKDYLKDPIDQKDLIWVELIDKDSNIGAELIRRNLACAMMIPPSNLPVGVSPTNHLQSRKSYASVVSSEEIKSPSEEPSHPEGAAGVWNDEFNGN